MFAKCVCDCWRNICDCGDSKQFVIKFWWFWRFVQHDQVRAEIETMRVILTIIAWTRNWKFWWKIEEKRQHRAIWTKFCHFGFSNGFRVLIFNQNERQGGWAGDQDNVRCPWDLRFRIWRQPTWLINIIHESHSVLKSIKSKTYYYPNINPLNPKHNYCFSSLCGAEFFP